MPRKKRLLQINVVANWGSTGKIVEEIGLEAMRCGWESYIAYGQFHPTSKSHLIRIGNKWDLLLHLLQSRILDRHGLASSSPTRVLIEQIEDIKPDIIHLHNIHGYFINYEILFSWLKSAGIPVVWTMHDCWAITGHCAYFSYINCNRWQQHCGHCPQKDTYPATMFIDRSTKNLHQKQKDFSGVKDMTIVAVSNWLKGIMQQSFLGSQYPIKQIYNGINTDIFFPYHNTEDIRRHYGIKTQYMLLAAATMWSPRKGFNDIIALSKTLDNRFTIVLVGLKKEIIKNLPQNIIGIERTENINEMAALYSAADIVLNLSYEETFGLTSAEGFACGTPSIVYDTTASPELINTVSETKAIDMVSQAYDLSLIGRIVPAGNIEMICKAITSILSHPKDSLVINTCRQHALTHFNKQEHYPEYIDLYNSLINKI